MHLYYTTEIKRKINKRKRLLKQRKRSPSNEIKHKLNSINAEIKSFYFTQKRNSVRRNIMAIQLHKLYNTNDQSLDWISLNFDQILTSRQTTFMISKTNKTKIGLNTMANRLSILNGRIPLSWLNATLSTYKVKCKKLFLDS